MELTARNATNKIAAIIIVVLLVLLVLSLVSTIYLVVRNHQLATQQQVIVTPMTYDAPFAISQARSSANHLQMMALSLMALRLNVSPETVDAQHEFLLSYIKPGAQPDFKIILAQEAQRIKDNEVNSAFYQTHVQAFPDQNRVDIQGVLKTWIGNAAPTSELKHYGLQLTYDNGITHIERFVEVRDDKQP